MKKRDKPKERTKERERGKKTKRREKESNRTRRGPSERDVDLYCDTYIIQNDIARRSVEDFLAGARNKLGNLSGAGVEKLK